MPSTQSHLSQKKDIYGKKMDNGSVNTYFIRRFWNLHEDSKRRRKKVHVRSDKCWNIFFYLVTILPYFNLTFRKHQCVSNFDSSAPCEITIIMKLFFELEYLMTRVRGTLSLWYIIHCILTAHCAFCKCNLCVEWGRKKKYNKN